MILFTVLLSVLSGRLCVRVIALASDLARPIRYLEGYDAFLVALNCSRHWIEHTFWVGVQWCEERSHNILVDQHWS